MNLTLQAAYGQRLYAARAAKARGEPVVGYVGNTVPVELIAAAGCMPVRIAPVDGPTVYADRHVEHFSDTDVRLIFDQFCSGELDFLDLLIVPRSTESQHKLYLSLREALRTGITTHGPALWLFEILHTQRDSSRAYGLARTQDLLQRLQSISGQAVTDTRLRAAIALGNDTRRALQALQQRRRAGEINGREAHVATGALSFLPPAAGLQALQGWLAGSGHSPCRGPRLLVKGCPLDHDALHAAVEQAGGCIVMEDDEWGARAAEPLIADGPDPLAAVFEHVWRDVPCVRHHPAPAVDGWYAQALQQRDISGVLFYLPAPDDIHGWTYPAERDAADRAGLPHLLIREDARRSSTLAALLRGFIATLPTGT